MYVYTGDDAWTFKQWMMMMMMSGVGQGLRTCFERFVYFTSYIQIAAREELDSTLVFSTISLSMLYCEVQRK